MTDRRIIVLRLRPEPSVEDADLALRRALKFLLRQCGLRCVGMSKEPTRAPVRSKRKVPSGKRPQLAA